MLPLLLVSAPTCLDILNFCLCLPLFVWRCCHCCWVCSVYVSGYVVIVVRFAPLLVLICCHCCWLLILYLSWYVAVVLRCLLFFLHLKTMLLIFTPLTVKMSPLHLSGDVAAVVDVYHLEDSPGVQFWDVGTSSRGLELHPASCFHLLHHLLITVVKIFLLFCRTFGSLRTIQWDRLPQFFLHSFDMWFYTRKDWFLLVEIFDSPLTLWLPANGNNDSTPKEIMTPLLRK